MMMLISDVCGGPVVHPRGVLRPSEVRPGAAVVADRTSAFLYAQTDATAGKWLHK